MMRQASKQASKQASNKKLNPFSWLAALVAAFGLTACGGGGGGGSDDPPPVTGDFSTAPVARDDAYSVAGVAPLAVPAAAGVLANDTDADAGDALTATLVTAPTQGTLGASGLAADGSFTYTRNAGAVNRTDSFTYRATDRGGNSRLATVRVSLNQAPVANNDPSPPVELTVPLNGELIIDVLANDTDANNDLLTIARTKNVSSGTATVNAAKDRVLYKPGTQTGLQQFDYDIEDGFGGTATATVTVRVTGAVANAPVARNDAITVQRNGTFAGNVGINDTFAAGDSFVLVTAPSNHDGVFALDADGEFTYEHDGDTSASDSFTYSIQRGTTRFPAATVQITITQTAGNAGPTALNDTVQVNPGQCVEIPVLYNDSDPDGDTLTITGVADPVNGDVVRDEGCDGRLADGLIAYFRDAVGAESDNFIYMIEDDAGNAAFATVTVNVTTAPNRAPVATPDSATAPLAGGAVAIPVRNNDTDPDGDLLVLDDAFVTPQPGNPAVVVPGPTRAGGMVMVNQNGTISYTPSEAAIVTPFNDTFNYFVRDSRGSDSVPVTVTVTVTAEVDNRPPVARNDPEDNPNSCNATNVANNNTAAEIAVVREGTVTINPLCNDTDPNNDPLVIYAEQGATVAPGTNQQRGRITRSADNRSLTYTHVRAADCPIGTAAGAVCATDEFNYSITDQRGGTDTATVTVTIRAPAAPACMPGPPPLCL